MKSYHFHLGNIKLHHFMERGGVAADSYPTWHNIPPLCQNLLVVANQAHATIVFSNSSQV
jgi:hypothetical protein